MTHLFKVSVFVPTAVLFPASELLIGQRYFPIRVPKVWGEGAVTAEFVWSHRKGA